MSSNVDPVVSVIIPTYKRSHLIARAVESVLRQTFSDFEAIVVNDGPSDGTAEVLATFCDDRIRLIQHERNMGSSEARNTGIRAARGRYLAFLDSDDEWLPEKLERQLAAFAAAPARVGVVYTERYATTDNVNFIIPAPVLRERSGDIRRSLMWQSAITPQVAMVQRKVFTTVGLFDGEMCPFEDWDFWVRVSQEFDFRFLDEPLAVIHADPNEEHLSASIAFNIQGLEAMLRKHALRFREAGDHTIAKQYYFLGNLLCRNGETDRGRHFLWLSIKMHPYRLKYIAVGILALAGIRPGTKLFGLWKWLGSVTG